MLFVALLAEIVYRILSPCFNIEPFLSRAEVYQVRFDDIRLLLAVRLLTPADVPSVLFVCAVNYGRLALSTTSARRRRADRLATFPLSRRTKQCGGSYSGTFRTVRSCISLFLSRLTYRAVGVFDHFLCMLRHADYCPHRNDSGDSRRDQKSRVWLWLLLPLLALAAAYAVYRWRW